MVLLQRQDAQATSTAGWPPQVDGEHAMARGRISAPESAVSSRLALQALQALQALYDFPSDCLAVVPAQVVAAPPECFSTAMAPAQEEGENSQSN